jgi:hypothetical protein
VKGHIRPLKLGRIAQQGVKAWQFHWKSQTIVALSRTIDVLLVPRKSSEHRPLQLYRLIVELSIVSSELKDIQTFE